MFSKEPRCNYQNNQLMEVICQLRFPEILAISAKAPVDFQEAIRGEFPQYAVRQESPAPRITGTPGNLTLQNQPTTPNHSFISADGQWRVNLTSKFISLSCRVYSSWEDFAAKLDQPLAAFIRIYKPAYFERVGLRYINAISRKALELEGTPFRDLIATPYLGILSDETVVERSVSVCGVDATLALRGGCQVKLHTGVGMVKRGNEQDKEPKFILDFDLFLPSRTPVNLSAGALQTLHIQADDLFRGAITDTLHDAMDPKY